MPSPEVVSSTIEAVTSNLSNVLNVSRRVEDQETWRASLQVGSECDACDAENEWITVTILNINGTQVKIHYNGWSSTWDEWLDISSERLQPLHSRVCSSSSTNVANHLEQWRQSLDVGDECDAEDTEG